jgi:DNA-binding FadR family transcriptional regulator
MLLELGNISDHSIDVEFIQLDLEFHKEIIGFTGNRRFMEINNEIYSYINLLGVEVVKIDTRKQESVDENEAILAAIASGDPIAAFKAACYHVEAIAKRLLKMMERQEKPEAQQDLNRVG